MSIFCYKVFDKDIYLNSNNGDVFDDYNFLMSHNNILDKDIILKFYEITTYYFCLNISNTCNLQCNYCFNKNKTNELMEPSFAIKSLDNLFKKFPSGERYFIDLSGKGEPLLNKKIIKVVSDFCKIKMNELKVEVIPTLVCNGTLLNEHNVDFLEQCGVLYGVSLDGNREIHDKNRITLDGKSTYDVIMSNIMNIKNRKYVGLACTLTNDVFDLSESVIYFSKIFNTLSFKLARGDESVLSEESCKKWTIEFEKLTLVLKDNIDKGITKLFFCLINGDDFYGTFLYRMFGNLRVPNRCDYGIQRFTIDFDGKIYGCPAASEISKLFFKEVSSELQKEELKRQLFECEECEMKYLCGGECYLEVIRNGKKRKYVCELKKKIILLTSYLKIYALRNYPDFFKKIFLFCEEKKARSKKDPALYEFISKHPELSFCEAKLG